MTLAKISGKPTTAASSGLAPHIENLYNRPGARVVGIVELEHIERTQPAPESEADPVVKLRLSHLEIASDRQEEYLRDTLLALYTIRTAAGTLTEAGEVELAESTVEGTGGLVTAVEAAELKVTMRAFRSRLLHVLQADRLTAAELRHEINQITTDMGAALSGITELHT